MTDNSILWRERKRTIFGLPLSFTKYHLSEERLIISTGLFNTKEDEVRLYRIMDVTLTRSFGEKIFGLGSIHVCSADKTSPEFMIKRIKKPRNVRDLLSRLVEDQRDKKRIYARESMSGMDDGDMDER